MAESLISGSLSSMDIEQAGPGLVCYLKAYFVRLDTKRRTAKQRIRGMFGPFTILQ